MAGTAAASRWRCTRSHYTKAPDLPHRSEYAEVTPELDTAVDPRSGWRTKEWLEEKYDVGGVLLGRPFKVASIGLVRLVKDMTLVVAVLPRTLPPGR